jgi:hypothetical protein
MQMSHVQPTVFLSYSHQDQPTARQLAHELEQRGAAVVIDDQVLRPGDNWPERIGEAIRNSDVFLILVSPASARSESVLLELGIAFSDENGPRVIPIRLSGAEIPTDLSDIIYLDADPNDLGSVADRVLISSGPSTGRHIGGLATEEVEQLLTTLKLAWQLEPSIAGVRPDFLVETQDAKRLVIEVKGRRNPSLLEAVAARSQAARLRELTGADDAVVVFPYVERALPMAGLVGLADLSAYLRKFIAAPPGPNPHTGDRPKPHSDEATVFASMPFKPQYDDVYWVAMTAAAEAVGATCVRVDRDDFDGDIPTRIKDYIESSIAVIADLSESNPDVLYEVGYARRHGCPCVQICSTPLEELPFNVRNINTLSYNQGRTYELRRPLSERLKAVIDGRAD